MVFASVKLLEFSLTPRFSLELSFGFTKIFFQIEQILLDQKTFESFLILYFQHTFVKITNFSLIEFKLSEERRL